MKSFPKIAVIVLLILTFIASCNKNEMEGYRQTTCESEKLIHQPRTDFISNDPLTTKYYPIWKSILMDRNGFNEAFFNEHINVFYLDTSIYNQTTYLAVGFEYKSGWAATNVYNELVIKINDATSPLSTAGLPIGVELSRKQIESLPSIFNNAMVNRIYPLSTNTGLKYNFESAKQAIKKKIKVTNLCSTWCGLNEKGHLSLRYSDHYFDKTTYCTDAELDLITGEISITSGECIID